RHTFAIGFSLEVGNEGDVVCEYYDLPILCEGRETGSHEPSADMVQGVYGVIQYQCRVRCIEGRFGEERGQAKRGPFTLAESPREVDLLTRSNELWLMKQRPLVCTGPGHRHTFETKSLSFPSEGIADHLRDTLLRKLENLLRNRARRSSGLGCLEFLTLP